MNVLYHRFISSELYPSKSASHCRYFYLKFCCRKPVRQQNSTTVNQRSIETMLFPICIELFSWLSDSVHHRFCRALVRCVCKQAKIHLSKIAFSYWSKWILAVIGTYWHRIDAIVCISEKWKSGFRSLHSQIRFILVHWPHLRSSFGQHRHRETMLWEPE